MLRSECSGGSVWEELRQIDWHVTGIETLDTECWFLGGASPERTIYSIGAFTGSQCKVLKSALALHSLLSRSTSLAALDELKFGKSCRLKDRLRESCSNLIG